MVYNKASENVPDIAVRRWSGEGEAHEAHDSAEFGGQGKIRDSTTRCGSS